MTLRQVLLGVVASTTFCLFPTVNQAQSIGELDNANGRYVDGCGSPQIWPNGRGSYGGNGVFYVVPNRNGDGALMNLDGRIINLRRTEQPKYRRLRRGSRFYEQYSGGGYMVRVDYTATRVGVTDHGQWGNYAVTITVRKGDRRRSVSALSSDAC